MISIAIDDLLSFLKGLLCIYLKYLYVRGCVCVSMWMFVTYIHKLRRPEKGVELQALVDHWS